MGTSLNGCRSPATRCASGAGASASRAWSACGTGHGRVGSPVPGGGGRRAKAIACELPATRGTPTSRWSLADLREELLITGLVEEISTTTLWRWLAEDAIWPWQYRSWVFPRAPDFAAKAGVALDLYQRRFQGRQLEPGQFVISADEKTSIQARCRCHPTLPPGVARMMKVEHEYQRGGALAYLAAWDVHQARLLAAASRRPASSPSAAGRPGHDG
jgi:hypothetical protein